MITSRYLPVSILYQFVQHVISVVRGIKFSVFQAIDVDTNLLSLKNFFSGIHTHVQHRNALMRLNLLSQDNAYINLSNVIWLKKDGIDCRHCNYNDGRIVNTSKLKIPSPLLYVNLSSVTLNSVWKTIVKQIPEFCFSETVFVDVSGNLYIPIKIIIYVYFEFNCHMTCAPVTFSMIAGSGLCGISASTFDFAAVYLFENDFKLGALLKHNIHTFIAENSEKLMYARSIHVQSYGLYGITNCHANTLLFLINDINSKVETDAAQRSRRYYLEMVNKFEMIIRSQNNNFERFYLLYIIPDDQDRSHDRDISREPHDDVDTDPSLMTTPLWLLEAAKDFHVINISLAPSLFMGVQNKIFLCQKL